MEIINGKIIAESILKQCESKLANLTFVPRLAIIMVGNNAASLTYIQKKKEAGEKVGIKVDIYTFNTANEEQITTLIEKLNADIQVAGIIVQLPLPEIDSYGICKAIAPQKDVDGLNPLNFGDIWLNSQPKLIPATVKAIFYALKHVAERSNLKIEDYLEGKTVLIINRSNVIGKPLAGLLLNHNATIILAHSKTHNIDELISQSDIIVSGTGKSDFIHNQNFKAKSVLIDVGFNKTKELVFGDVTKEFNNAKIGWITPVPGGIGPIGVACLIENVIEAANSTKI